MSQSSATTVRDQSRAQWRERMARQAASGLSVAAFCKEQGLVTQTFYWWRARLARPDRPMRDGKRETVPFIDLGAWRETAASALDIDIRLDLGNGMVLTIARR